LKVDNLSRERMCVGSEFQVDGAETECPRGEVTSDAGRSGQKILCWKNVRLWVEGSG